VNNKQEPVAWALIYPSGHTSDVSVSKDLLEDIAAVGDTIVPLYFSSKLKFSNAEIEALKWCIEHLQYMDYYAKTFGARALVLQGLLERGDQSGG
jgi:hypothetical protein